MLKKSDVLREGYVKGLKKAQRIIESVIAGKREIEEHVIWGNDRKTIEPIKERLRAEAEADPDTNDWAFDENDEIDEEALNDAALEDAICFFDDVIRKLKKLTYGDEVIVMRRLQNGSTMLEKHFDDIEEAIGYYMEDTNKIYVYGSQLRVDATYHDRTDTFIIYGIDQGGLDYINRKYEYESYDKAYDAETLMHLYFNDMINGGEFDSCLRALGPVIAKAYGW